MFNRTGPRRLLSLSPCFLNSRLIWLHDIQHDNSRHNDTHHDDTRHNDAQHNELNRDTQRNDTQHKKKYAGSVFMLNVVYAVSRLYNIFLSVIMLNVILLNVAAPFI